MGIGHRTVEFFAFSKSLSGADPKAKDVGLR
jgi:hypothetical protein